MIYCPCTQYIYLINTIGAISKHYGGCELSRQIWLYNDLSILVYTSIIQHIGWSIRLSRYSVNIHKAHRWSKKSHCKCCMHQSAHVLRSDAIHHREKRPSLCHMIAAPPEPIDCEARDDYPRVVFPSKEFGTSNVMSRSVKYTINDWNQY